MRRVFVIPLAILAMLTACTPSYKLERPLTPQTGDWLQYGGNAARRNISSVSPKQLAGDGRGSAASVRWEYSLDGPAGKAAPLLLDRTVLFFSTTGWGEAVDLESGEEVGLFPCKWFIHATPAVADGCLFVATNGIAPLLLCFDLQEQRIRYAASIPSVHSSLCAVGKQVILAAHDGSVRSYGRGDSLPRWTRELHDVISAAPAANDSVVVVAGQNGDLNALAVSDGRKLWRISTGAAFLSGPTVGRDAVVAINSAGLITMADLASGSTVWQRDLGEPGFQGLAWQGDQLAVALAGGDLLLLNAADGKEIRRIATDELPGAAPVFHGQHILLLQRRGVLIDIDPATGNFTEIARLAERSETAPLLTPLGIVLVDEEGEAVLIEWKDGMMKEME